MKDLKIFTGIVNTVIKYFKWILFVAAVLILCSGIVRVDSNEEAIVLRFGSLVGDTREEQILKPGLHFTLPFFVDEVIKVPVQSVKELTVTTHMTNGNSLKNLYESGYLLTGDNNIVLLSANVKYKITDPVAYALYIGDVDCTINGVVSGVLTETVCSMYVDQVLTTDRTALAETAKSASQSELDQLQVGVTVTNVEFSQIVPPGNVIAHFEAVNTAAVEKQTKIEKANQYKETKIPEAQANAQSLIQNASVKQSEAISAAKNEMAQFDGLLAQFNANPSVVYDGIFRSRASAVLAKMGVQFLLPSDGDSPRIILP